MEILSHKMCSSLRMSPENIEQKLLILAIQLDIQANNNCGSYTEPSFGMLLSMGPLRSTGHCQTHEGRIFLALACSVFGSSRIPYLV